ncbi:MAG: DsbA family protein [Caldilineae bacterium]|nr:DsbA family protein [Anaerolineae bacterium]MCB9154739.1 DsbA family protein [Caldilineae bacterium]
METEPKLKETLVADGTVRLIYKHFPLPSHDRADDASEAAECAAQQGKFWEMKDLLFEENASWGAAADLPGKFEEYATQLGLDVAAFQACLDSGGGRQRWQEDRALGQNAGVTGTPTFFIFSPATGQGTRIPGFVEYDQLVEVINQVLAAPPADG